MKRILNIIVKVLFPLLFAGGILWWMYRQVAWADIQQALESDMRWGWMILSLPFGVLAQVLRATRWRQSLRAIGQPVRLGTSINAVFLSYASSLLVPRVGEVLRCGVLRRWDGVRFVEGVGTVVCERGVDMRIILVLTAVTVVVEIPVFADFMSRTGMSLVGILQGLTGAGYLVTAVCGLLILLMGWYLVRRLGVYRRTRELWQRLVQGLGSIRLVENKGLFWSRSLGIWLSYYLHFYLTFFCFGFTEDLGMMCALVAFVVGSFAVLVPTPNGAGSWHFAVKTVLVLYGVGANEGVLFVLIVHTIQTLLVALLGLWAMGALALTKEKA